MTPLTQTNCRICGEDLSDRDIAGHLWDEHGKSLAPPQTNDGCLLTVEWLGYTTDEKLTAIQLQTLRVLAEEYHGMSHHALRTRLAEDHGIRISADVAYDRCRALDRRGLVGQVERGWFMVYQGVRFAMDAREDCE